MSHASCIVALSPADLEAADDLQAAVSHQMEPFDEGGEWFAEGSRWDWWTIGGRYTGKLAVDAYDPASDPRNIQTCWLCRGGGLRNDDLGIEERRRNPDYTCNGCQGTGKMVKYAGDFVDIGNTCLRSALTEDGLRAKQRKSAEETWARFQAERCKDDFTRKSLYGFDDDETLESLIARNQERYLTAYAFLKDRRWCEGGRLGWFGMTTATECTIKAAEARIDYEGRCLYTCQEMNAQIVTWEEDDKQWQRMFWPRFIRNLPGDTTLVVVDYHV